MKKTAYLIMEVLYFVIKCVFFILFLFYLKQITNAQLIIFYVLSLPTGWGNCELREADIDGVCGHKQFHGRRH